MKKQNFLEGTLVLTASVVLVKIISALYKIPLNNIIGAEGYAYFIETYDVYSLLLIISTAGLPVAVSRMIADASAKKNYAQVRQINRASLGMFTALGVIGAVIMMALSKPLARLMGIPDCPITFIALGPAVLFVCVNSAFRGYFQGQEIMTPTGISQVVEALFKLVLGLFLAYLIQKLTGVLTNAVAGAILGVTVGSVVAFAYLCTEYMRHRAELGSGDPTQAKPLKETALELLQIAIPITIGSAGLQLFNLIDSSMIMNRLQNAAGLAYDEAKALRGLYGTSQTMFGLPSALVTPFTVTLIPAITSCIAKKDGRGALRAANSEIRIMSLIIVPCAVGLGVLGRPIIHLLYSAYDTEQCAVTGTLLSILSPAILFNGLILLMNTILQAHGYVYLPIISMLGGGVIKVLINAILVGIPSVNIYGAPIGTALSFLGITLADVYFINRVLRHPPHLFRLMKKTLLAGVIMGAGTYAAYYVLGLVLSDRLACIGSICIAVVIYAVLVLKLHLITYEDCLMMPKGEKIAKILHFSAENQQNG